jgi:hypothetical protein
VLMEQLQSASRGLPGDLLDMACGQADFGVGLGEDGASDRDGCSEALGNGAGRRSLWNAVSPQECRDIPILVKCCESFLCEVPGPFRGCAAPADRDAVLMQGPQHQLDGGVGGDLGGRPFPVQIQVAKTYGIQAFSVLPTGPGLD